MSKFTLQTQFHLLLVFFFFLFLLCTWDSIIIKIWILIPVFFIWKSLHMLQKARIKIVACAIYTNPFFLTLILWPLFFFKIKSCCDCCFPQQIRPLTAVKLCILQDYFYVRIVFNMNHKHQTLPTVYTVLA